MAYTVLQTVAVDAFVAGNELQQLDLMCMNNDMIGSQM